MKRWLTSIPVWIGVVLVLVIAAVAAKRVYDYGASQDRPAIKQQPVPVRTIEVSGDRFGSGS